MSAGALRGLVVVVAMLAFAAPAQAGLSVLDNGTIRVGVDLDQGGKITLLSRSSGEHADNLLFEAEQSYYGGADWHGYQDPAAVVDHSNDGKTLYTRAISASCECAMQTWITLAGDAAVVHNRLTSFRSDATPYPPAWQELPALYAVGPLYRIVTYDGSAPYTRGPMHDVTQDAAQFQFFTPYHRDVLATEHWEAVVDDSGFGIGLLEPDLLRFISISSGSPSWYLTGYLAGVRQEVLDANVVYDYTYTLVVGTLDEIRAYAYAHRPDPRPSYVFAHDREHFTEQNAGDAGFPIAGALRVRLDQDDPQLIGPEQEWPAARVPRLYIRGAWHTHQSLAELFWGSAGDSYPFSGDRVRPFRVIPDGQFRTYRLDLFRSPTYTGTIEGLRLDPIANGEPGAWVDITCISWKPCPINRAAERRLAGDRGRVPFLDTFDTLSSTFWSVTGNSTGATTSVADGELQIDVAPAAQPLAGQDSISAGVYSRCTLSGDFDAQVDYRLNDWPADNGVNLNFGVGDRTLFRHNGAGGNEWLSSYFPPFQGSTITSVATTGSLRLVRTGGFVRGYFRGDAGDWVTLDGASITAAPVNVSLSIFTNRGTAGAQQVDVAFDNFRVTRGAIVCP